MGRVWEKLNIDFVVSTIPGWRALMATRLSNPSRTSTRPRAYRSRDTSVSITEPEVWALYCHFDWRDDEKYSIYTFTRACALCASAFSVLGKPWLQGWRTTTVYSSPAEDRRPIYLHEIVHRERRCKFVFYFNQKNLLGLWRMRAKFDMILSVIADFFLIDTTPFEILDPPERWSLWLEE